MDSVSRHFQFRIQDGETALYNRILQKYHSLRTKQRQKSGQILSVRTDFSTGLRHQVVYVAYFSGDCLITLIILQKENLHRNEFFFSTLIAKTARVPSICIIWIGISCMNYPSRVLHIDGLVPHCTMSIANELEILQYGKRPTESTCANKSWYSTNFKTLDNKRICLCPGELTNTVCWATWLSFFWRGDAW